jgi:hypothetical protein
MRETTAESEPPRLERKILERGALSSKSVTEQSYKVTRIVRRDIRAKSVPMPTQPLTRSIGMTGKIRIRSPQGTIVINVVEVLVILLAVEFGDNRFKYCVWMYRGEAEFFHPEDESQIVPEERSKLILFAPIKNLGPCLQSPCSDLASPW